MNVSHYILKFKFFFKNTCSAVIARIHVRLLQSKREMIYFPNKFSLIFIHTNLTHILDMSCFHKHQQEKYQNEKQNKICMFIHYMYIDILFPRRKAIPIMFERVTTHVNLYKDGQTMMQRVTITSTHYRTRQHTLPYIFPQFNIARL